MKTETCRFKYPPKASTLITACIFVIWIVPIARLGLAEQVRIDVSPRFKNVSDSAVHVVINQGRSSLRVMPGGSKCFVNLNALQMEQDNRIPVSINSPDDVTQVCNLNQDGDKHVYVVSTISSCPGNDDGSNILGCTAVGGKCSIIAWLPRVDLTSVSQWMHEYAHTQGIPHRSGPGLLMNQALLGPQLDISYPDCATVQGVGSPKPVREKKIGRGNRATTISKNPEVSLQPSQNGVPIEEFVERLFIHGVPLDEARTYDQTDSEKLIRMLANACRVGRVEECAQAYTLPNIITVIGAIGNASDGDLKALTSFLDRTATSPGWSLQARQAIPIAIGRLLSKAEIHSTARQEMLAFLEKGALSEGWNSEAIDQSDFYCEELAKASILGLGLSGTPEAAKALIDISTRQGSFFQQTTVRHLIKHSLALYSEAQLE